MKTTTESLKSVEIKTNSKAERIYPVVSYNKDGDEHKTIALKLTKTQAIELATSLLIGAKKWDDMRITAFRPSNSITVTSQQLAEQSE